MRTFMVYVHPIVEYNSIIWQSSLDQGRSVRALLIDSSKAFDRVNHNILFMKALERGVPHSLMRWFFFIPVS